MPFTLAKQRVAGPAFIAGPKAGVIRESPVPRPIAGYAAGGPLSF